MEFNLKRCLICNSRTTKLTWDDVIDLFIVAKQQQQVVTFDYRGGGVVEITGDGDDLVNVSGEDGGLDEVKKGLVGREGAEGR